MRMMFKILWTQDDWVEIDFKGYVTVWISYCFGNDYCFKDLLLFQTCYRLEMLVFGTVTVYSCYCMELLLFVPVTVSV